MTTEASYFLRFDAAKPVPPINVSSYRHAPSAVIAAGVAHQAVSQFEICGLEPCVYVRRQHVNEHRRCGIKGMPVAFF